MEYALASVVNLALFFQLLHFVLNLLAVNI